MAFRKFGSLLVKASKMVDAVSSLPEKGGEVKDTYSISPVSRSDCSKFILEIHYAKRWPSITFAFGLFRDEKLAGVVTYGTPPSAPLRSGIAGPEMASHILELNRLVLLDNRKMEASMLVGRSLRLIPKNKIVISFADTSQNHLGVVYQACNFLYCGLSAIRTDWKIKGMEHLHGQTVADEFRGKENRSALMREKYGDDFYLCRIVDCIMQIKSHGQHAELST